MLKKRLIFTLLYEDGFFVQSRNFNLQKVGDIEWIKKNYNFRNISFFIDELIILDISRGDKDSNKFIENIKKISELCFVPISIGGGVDTCEKAQKILSNGADKILLNSINFANKEIIKEISNIYGKQSIILAVDIKKKNNDYEIYKYNGSVKVDIQFSNFVKNLHEFSFGEIYINSIDRDGTGNGLDYEFLDHFPKNFNKPIIISGGCGKASHINDGLLNPIVSAISTANLLNFVGNGLELAREELIKNNNNFPIWQKTDIEKLENIFL